MMAESLDPEEFPYVHMSRFGVIPKANRQLIVDLLAPEGASINDGIDSHLTSLSYVGVEDAAGGSAVSVWEHSWRKWT